MNQRLPIIALVGAPNAGKSTLLNKIIGAELAVTSNIAGTTRDRQYANTSWNGATFTIIDTAGFSETVHDNLSSEINEQIDIATKEADVLVFVIDGKVPLEALPRQTLLKFRKIKKPIILAINKLDSAKFLEEKVAPFLKLGIKSVFPISSLTGRGIGDMLDILAEQAKKLKLEDLPEEYIGIAVSIIGKPNVGKSSIFNSIVKQKRVVVSPIAGTTRAAIDTKVQIGGQTYTFIDTAGLKKKIHRQVEPDIFSGFQTYKSIRKSDVCLFVIDATEEITKQDQAVAQEIFTLEKGCIVLANKMDIYNGSEEKLQEYISHHFPFLWMSPIFFVSGKTGQGIEEAIESVLPIYERRHKTIDQEQLDSLLKKAIKKNGPKLLRDQKVPKVYGLSQLATNPPVFELLVNHPAAISMQFRKFLQNSITKELDFFGTPIVLKLKKKQ